MKKKEREAKEAKTDRAVATATLPDATAPATTAGRARRPTVRRRRFSESDEASVLYAIDEILLDEADDTDVMLLHLLTLLLEYSGAAGGAIFTASHYGSDLRARVSLHLPCNVVQKFPSLALDATFPDRILRTPIAASSQATSGPVAALMASCPSGALVVPLKFRDAVVGLIYLAAPKAPMGTDGASLLATMGRRLSRLVHHQQAYEAAKLRSNKLASVISISATMDRSFRLRQLLDLITQQAAHLLEAESCFLALPTEEGDALEIKSCFGRPKRLNDMRLGLNDTVCGRVFSECWPIVIDSLEDYPLIGAKDLDMLEPLKTAIIVPLLMKSRPLGTLLVMNKENDGEYTADDQELLSAIGNQAAMVLENAILFDKVSQGKAEWENVFDSLTDLIAVQNGDGRIVRVNKAMAHRLDTTPRNLLGKKCSAVIHGPDGNASACPHAVVLSDHRYREEEAVLPHLDGIFMLSTFPLFDSHRKLYAYVHVLKDITLQKKLEQQLLQAQKMESMGTLAGGIAHDFNNILAAIIPNAEMIKRKLPSEDALYKRAEMIEKAARRAADLTRQLLSFSRKWKSGVTVLNLNQSIGATADLLARLINKNISFETRLPPDAWNIEANETQIAQVLLNLALNACDAMPKGGVLAFATVNTTLDEVSCRTKLGLRPGRYVCVSVSDTGIGMKRELLERVFEPFYTTKELGKGTGLGLSVVYGIVKNHSGHIEVQSEVGRGTVFNVYFPATDWPLRREKAAPDADLPRGEGKILVADDEDMVRTMLCDLLQELGYQVVPARDGAEALDIYRARHHEIDLVILDMIMPKLDGGETYTLLKQMNPEIKAILSSGYSQEGKVQEIVKEGISGFIQKPYSTAEIARVIRDTLRKGKDG